MSNSNISSIISVPILMRLPLSALRQELSIKGIKYSQDDPKRTLATKIINELMKSGELANVHSPAFNDLLLGYAPSDIPSNIVRITRGMVNRMTPSDIVGEAESRGIKIPTDLNTKDSMSTYFIKELSKRSIKFGERSVINPPYTPGFHRQLLLKSCSPNLGIRVGINYKGESWEIFLDRSVLKKMNFQELLEEAWNQNINFDAKEPKEELIDRLLLFYQSRPQSINRFSPPLRRHFLRMASILRESAPIVKSGVMGQPVPVITTNTSIDNRDLTGSDDFIFARPNNTPGTVINNMDPNINPSTVVSNPQITQNVPSEGALSLTKSLDSKSLVIGSTPFVREGGGIVPVSQPVPIVIVTPDVSGNMSYLINPTSVPVTITPSGQVLASGQDFSFASDGKGGMQVMFAGSPVNINQNGLIQQRDGSVPIINEELGILMSGVEDVGIPEAIYNFDNDTLRATGLLEGIMRSKHYLLGKEIVSQIDDERTEKLRELLVKYDDTYEKVHSLTNLRMMHAKKLEQLFSRNRIHPNVLTVMESLKIIEESIVINQKNYISSVLDLNVDDNTLDSYLDNEIELRSRQKSLIDRVSSVLPERQIIEALIGDKENEAIHIFLLYRIARRIMIENNKFRGRKIL